MTYKFDWKDAAHRQVEIEAKNGFEAERLFREMSLEQRLKASSVDVDKGTLEIKFVDAGLGDVHTAEEWNNDIRHIT
ncbi:hypothetical protein [Candidatus Ponderosibacter sp. Uisw_141_02]|uniref:hypothetical protein n=1 Tax=Candidatus Ponderosibacter sp. Uisw_141_02 TaxID=3231000 RepID=UPI003D3EF07C